MAIDKDKVLKAEIRKAKPPVMILVDKGLYLQLATGVAQSWIYRYQLKGKRRFMGLGSFPEISLAKAREDAKDARQLVAEGVDPIDERKARESAEALAKAQLTTFSDCAASYIAAHRSGWKNAKHAAQWKNTLETYAGPVIGALPVGEVNTEHVLEIINPIWGTKTETASRVRNRIELVLDAAKVKGLRSGENPARWRGHLDKLLPKRSKVQTVKHHAALPWKEMPDFWKTLKASSAYGAKALQFAILTACRTSEVTGAQWDEIDLEAQIWRIPRTRMKTDAEHTVPLSDAATAILKAQKGQHDRWVFPGRNKGKSISYMSMAMNLRRLERQDITVHGFRSTFRDWCAEETHYPRDVCETALAHTVGNHVEAAYRRGDLLKKRTALMKDWASYVVTKPASNLIELKETQMNPHPTQQICVGGA